MDGKSTKTPEERGLFLIARKVGDGLERAVEIPVFLLSIVMTVTVLAGVFFRYIVRAPLGWSEELSRYLMIWMALLSVALCIWRHEHVGVTMFIRRIETETGNSLPSPRPRRLPARRKPGSEGL